VKLLKLSCFSNFFNIVFPIVSYGFKVTRVITLTHKYILEVKIIERWLNIKLARCLLVLSENELTGLLRHDPTLWQTAIKRGKGFIRSTQTTERVAQKIQAEAEKNSFID